MPAGRGKGMRMRVEDTHCKAWAACEPLRVYVPGFKYGPPASYLRSSQLSVCFFTRNGGHSIFLIKRNEGQGGDQRMRTTRRLPHRRTAAHAGCSPQLLETWITAYPQKSGFFHFSTPVKEQGHVDQSSGKQGGSWAGGCPGAAAGWRLALHPDCCEPPAPAGCRSRPPAPCENSSTQSEGSSRVAETLQASRPTRRRLRRIMAAWQCAQERESLIRLLLRLLHLLCAAAPSRLRCAHNARTLRSSLPMGPGLLLHLCATKLGRLLHALGSWAGGSPLAFLGLALGPRCELRPWPCPFA